MQQTIDLNRRRFLLYNGVMAGTLLAPRQAYARVIQPRGGLRRPQAQKALVVCYSQTGHTERYARLISSIWVRHGLRVDMHRLRFGDDADVSGYDLVAIGTPVQYLDVPKNVGDWMARIGSLHGVGVSSFVSYGGEGDGQHDAAFSLLAGMVDKGGVALGMDTFGNMSTYPPTWSMGNQARILRYRHKPDLATYGQVRAFAASVLAQYARGVGIEAKNRPGFMGLFKGDVSRTLSKAVLGRHTIDAGRCVRCGGCVKTCPVGAIDLDRPRIDTERCILCFGCVNNCPTGAHAMTVLGKPIYGFPEFLRRNGIELLEPPLTHD
ncbi:MAG TPA: 4Fe-4S binding protein [Deltaproteobacteria bacterium]|nr:4Fe-4S binding protein [Deltaproteobacteria bacterium]